MHDDSSPPDRAARAAPSPGPASPSHPAHRHDRPRQRGAVLIEMALVFPVLVALLAGFIDFGWVLNDLQTTRHEAREIARDAVVGLVDTRLGCTHLAGAQLGATSTGLLCDAKRRLGGDVRVRLELPGGSYAVGEPLRLCLEFPYESLTGLYAGQIDGGAATVRVESRIEVELPDPLEPFSEPSLPGHDWGFCA